MRKQRVSVNSIVVTTVAAGKGKKRGQVTIAVKDDCGAPVANATVFGAFSGSLNESVSGVTNANGVVTLLTKWRRRRNCQYHVLCDQRHACQPDL